MKISDEEAHRLLTTMARDHVDSAGDELTEEQINGVGEPEKVMEMPEMDLTDSPGPRPSSIPAQVGASVAAAAPRRKLDPSQPLGYRPPKDIQLSGFLADAKARRSEASLGQAVTDFTERPTNFLDYAQRLGGGGVSAAPAKSEIWKDHAEEGDRAIADLGAQRAGDAHGAKNAEENDPNSETAQAWRAMLAKFNPELGDRLKGSSAAVMRQIAPGLEKYVGQQAAALKSAAAVAAAEEKKALHLKERGEDVANRKDVHKDAQAIADSNNAIARASLGIRAGADKRDAAKDEAAAAEKAKGHLTATSTLEGLADAETAINELGPLGEKFTALGMSGAVAKGSGMLTDALDLQWTDAAEFKAASQRAMQGVGKIMEGGKLAAGDEVKYRQMLPRAGDPPELAKQKIVESQAFLRQLKDNRIKVLRAAGYNVPDVGGAQVADVIVTHGGKRYRQLADGTGEEVP